MYPELVKEDQNGMLAVDYIGLIPILIETIKEQSIEIEKIKSIDNKKFKNAGGELSENMELTASLSKNSPNPFNQETIIEFYLATSIRNAILYIYDLQGKQIKSINIVQCEYGSETIYASELSPGMYKYALIADGTIVGTETMILTD